MERSFFYWKTVFKLAPKEKQALTELSIKKLYVKFFDVVWDGEKHSAQPVAVSIFNEAPPSNITITPVVFIKQEPLQYLDVKGIDSLSVNLAKLLASIATSNHLSLSQEIQLDCDWTSTTKEAYFHLINALKKQPFFQRKIVSATIRLHQAKFVSQNGVPPVDKGLLMCYNMGNLRYPQTRNSIIDEEELRKYVNNLETYKLPLDVALPIFDWWVLFDGNKYRGLLRDFNAAEGWKGKPRIHFERDTIINGFTFKAGQWLRHESSDKTEVKNCAALIAARLKQKELTVILYHLTEDNLDRYDRHEMENFYNSFR